MEEPKELRAGDRVKLVNLVNKPQLNGKEGFVSARECVNDGTVDPSLARLPGNKYIVLVEVESDFRPGSKPGVTKRGKSKEFKLKRENLELVEASMSTVLRTAASIERGDVVDMGGIRMSSTAELERRDPGIAGLIPAVMNGDSTRVREIMEHIKVTCHTSSAADRNLDCTGSTPLLGAVQHGQKEVVEVLLQYGADVNAQFGPLNPLSKDLDLTPLLLAIQLAGSDRPDEREDIVFLLIEAGADVNKVSSHSGSPLVLVTRSDFGTPEFRMKLLKTLLDKGAVPSCVKANGLYVSPLMQTACMGFFGREEDQLEAVQLLLDHGADPGELGGHPSREMCTTLHAVASRRLWRVLEVLLRSEKGRAAVNKKKLDKDETNGSTPIYIAMDDEKLDSSKTTDGRRCVALLLQYGADFHIANAVGCPPYYGLTVMKTPKVKELRCLVDNAPKPKNKEAVFEYWSPSNPEVQQWIGEGTSTKRRCPVCLVWSDMQRAHNQVEFKACGRCGKQYYCSRDCQRAHWKIHKKVCKQKA